MTPTVSAPVEPPAARERARPFLKWAGGKRQLLPELRRYTPTSFEDYYEPFVGSGAVFFDLWESGALDEKRATLVDSNADLIGCYAAIMRDVEAVVSVLRKLAAAHQKNPRAHFYRIRDEQFNPARRKLPGTDAGYALDTAKAADFLYFDPPYAPLNTTARFTSYTAAGFSDADQRRLQEVVIDLALRGCRVVVSNSTAPLITELYARSTRARRAGLRAHIVAAKRSINSDPTRRGEIAEYIITNVQRG